MMSGAYVSRFLERKAGVPENELEGVVYADWQPGDSANGLVMSLTNWKEQELFKDVKVDFNVAEWWKIPVKTPTCRNVWIASPTEHHGIGGSRAMRR